jgi:hypothetical protein
MLFLGEVEVGLWRGLCEDEVEGQSGSSWRWLPGRCLGASVAGGCVSGFLHFVPTARVVG